jgi:ribulose kinase
MTSSSVWRPVVIGVDFATLSGRAVVEEQLPHAGLRRRDPPAAVAARVGAGPALGSAMHAAVAAGAYPDIHAAWASMGRKQTGAYAPDERRARAYGALYAEYDTLRDCFGRGGNDVMHRLREIKRKAGRP